MAPLNDFFYITPEQLQEADVYDEDPEPYLTTRNNIDYLGGLGCACNNGEVFYEDDAEEITVPFNGILPWNYDHHRIDLDTWEIAAGAGVGVAVIDTGVSDEQENLGEDFNSLPSSPTRIIEKYNVLNYYLSSFGNIIRYNENQSPHDLCGHGTKMAGLIGAPRGFDGNAVGVAPDCDLYIYRAVFNPLIDTGVEKLAVRDAIVAAANNPAVDIISMSIGQPINARDMGIDEAIGYASGLGKMILCAAGTAFDTDLWSWRHVVYPAKDSRTIALTGVKFPIHTYPNALSHDEIACNGCFYGDSVNFAVIMQRQENIMIPDNDERTTLAITCDGDTPVYSNGSSCATATFAGMAAMVWSNQGSAASEFSVLTALINAASNSTSPHPDFGFGWVDMELALDQ